MLRWLLWLRLEGMPLLLLLLLGGEELLLRPSVGCTLGGRPLDCSS